PLEREADDPGETDRRVRRQRRFVPFAPALRPRRQRHAVDGRAEAREVAREEAPARGSPADAHGLARDVRTGLEREIDPVARSAAADLDRRRGHLEDVLTPLVAP